MVNNFHDIHNFAGLSFYRCRPIEKLDKTLYADIDDVHLGVLSFFNGRNPCELSNIPFLEAHSILSYRVKVEFYHDRNVLNLLKIS